MYDYAKERQNRKRDRVLNPRRSSVDEKIEIQKWRTHVERSKRMGLETTLTYSEWEYILDRFGHRCAVSFSFDHSLEHFIPQSIGGPTSKENCYPMDLQLNIQKGNQHPFYWAGSNANVDPALFLELVSYLAELNQMTVDVYRRYVDWCFLHRRCDKEAFLEAESIRETQCQLYQCMKEMLALSDIGMADYVSWCYINKHMVGLSSLQTWVKE